ncbi:MAG: hypothetical protein AAFV19_04785 [Pseudomonadota bacterium]
MTDTLDARYDADQDTPATDSAGHQMVDPGTEGVSVRRPAHSAAAPSQRLPQYVRHG